MRQLISVLSIMVLLCGKANAQDSGRMKWNFKSKAEILEWGEREFGYSGDTTSFDIEGKTFFVIYGNYASGCVIKTIFVFSLYNTAKKEDWALISFRQTNTSAVSVESDKSHHQIVFKSKTGRALMILPFETLSLPNERDEQ